MVHNGIEYGDMQVIAEAYSLMKASGCRTMRWRTRSADWGDGVLDSFLIDITADILATSTTDGSPLVENILDAAGQKGTGKWTVISSMELGQPVSLVAEAVYARIVSSFKDLRVDAAGRRDASGPSDAGVRARRPARRPVRLEDRVLRPGLHAVAGGVRRARLGPRPGQVASLWRAGCIIRAALPRRRDAGLRREEWTTCCSTRVLHRGAGGGSRAGAERSRLGGGAGVPVPAYSSALAFYDAFHSAQVSANLIQAQRDYFGAHTYERVDRPRGEWFHTDWTGRGGTTTSRSYDA
jgi:6-phosphogluconate dehydrogenase